MRTQRITALATFKLFALLLLVGQAPIAQAAEGPKWRINSVSNTTAQPGSTLDYRVEINNTGEEPTNGSFELRAQLPAGVKAISAKLSDQLFYYAGFYECFDGSDGASPAAGAESVVCPNPDPLYSPPAGAGAQMLELKVEIPPDAGGTLQASFEVSGGGAAAATTVDPTVVSPSPAGFGVDAFDATVEDAKEGGVSTTAGAHPESSVTTLAFNTADGSIPMENTAWPVEPARDVLVDLPPGLVGNPSALDQCTNAELSNGNQTSSQPLCAPSSQVGTIMLRSPTFPYLRDLVGPISVFNMVPPPGTPARFGFNFFNTITMIDVRLRSDGDYGVSTTTSRISEALALNGFTIEFWGVPFDQSHDRERHCPGEQEPYGTGVSCTVSADPVPFLRNPTSCTAPGAGVETSVSIDSWDDPGRFDPDGGADLSDPAWKSGSSVSHEAPGYPYPPSQQGEEVGIEGCDDVPFHPSFSATPTTDAPASPSGLEVDLSIPQSCWQKTFLICQSDLREASVTLPPGMSVNPSSAGGLGACSPSEIGLRTPTGATPARFSSAPASCPDSSKIGSVRIETPLLDDDLEGAVYLAKQSENPFGSLLAMYLVAEGSGVVVKQAGRIETDPQTGRLTTVFSEAPQTPFSHLEVNLFGGQRAALRTPSACGTHSVQATLAPWSGTAPATRASSFQINGCRNAGFDPKLSAGSRNPLGGAFSPFNLRLSRDADSEELKGLTATLPEGLIGKLAGIPYCSDATLASISGALGAGAAQIASPSCPAASRIGTVTVGAGAGTNPFYTSEGRIYLAGPYKGAPLSLAVVTPAVAGPFDLGNVVVRNALRVNPRTTQITAVSDPLPTILYGIPLDLRDIRIDVDRPQFVVNPTSCDPMSIDATLTSAGNASVERSQRFQLGGCSQLPFKPLVSLKLRGGTKRAAHPSLRAVVTAGFSNESNVAHSVVTLPRSEFLAQDHIRTVCTRVQYAAGAGSGTECPAGSIYGRARAITPLLDEPLSGPVILRSSSHKLPDLVVSLRGQIAAELVGRIDTKNRGIRVTFESVPDAFVEKFVLTMQGGKKGLLENSTNICRGRHRATMTFDAHNGKVRDVRPILRATNCAKPRKSR